MMQGQGAAPQGGSPMSQIPLSSLLQMIMKQNAENPAVAGNVGSWSIPANFGGVSPTYTLDAASGIY